jgi:hypothetical protein
MRYLIDGHNLIPNIPGLHLKLLDDEQRLIHLLKGFCRKQRDQAEIYFDNASPGQERKQSHGAVTAHFVRQGQTADDAIRRRLISLGRSARNWTVVSSDHRIQAAAREVGARIVRVEVFARQIFLAQNVQEADADKSVDHPLKEKEIEEWLEIFQKRDLEKKG